MKSRAFFKWAQLFVPLISILVAAFVPYYYQSQYYKNSANLTQAAHNLTSQESKIREVELKYLNSAKEQHAKLNDLELVIRDSNIAQNKLRTALDKYAVSDVLTPELVATSTIRSVGHATREARRTELLLCTFKLNNTSTRPFHVDAAVVRLYVAELGYEAIRDRYICNNPNTAGPVKWNLLHETVESNELFRHDISKYTIPSRLKDINWIDPVTGEYPRLIGKIGRNTNLSHSFRVFLPYDFLVLAYVEMTVFYRFSNADNVEIFGSRTTGSDIMFAR